jgi:membrane protein YdbS with pleckstrin-like domain
MMLQKVLDVPMETLLIPAAVLLILAIVSLVIRSYEGLLALVGPAAFLALLAGILWLLRVAASDRDAF